MTKKRPPRGLGRGLSALMADIDPAEARAAATAGVASDRAEQRIPIDQIMPNSDQPRKLFNADKIDELAASIREKGVIQPLILRRHPTDVGMYEIVAGERRWRAAQLARLHELPALVREFTDQEVLEVAIIENIQRSDLNPLEEALGYRQLMERFGHTQEKLAEAMGKSRSHVANLMRLLQLPEEIQNFVSTGQLTAGHARAMITADDPIGLARRAVREGLSVRQVEAAAQSVASKREGAQRRASKRGADADTRKLEAELSATIGSPVSIQHQQGRANGKIVIKYKDLDALDRLVDQLKSI